MIFKMTGLKNRNFLHEKLPKRSKTAVCRPEKKKVLRKVLKVCLSRRVLNNNFVYFINPFLP